MFTVEQVQRIAGSDRAAQASVALWAFLHGAATLEAAQVLGEIRAALTTRALAEGCQSRLKSSLCFIAEIAKSPLFQSFGSRLAVQERCNESSFFMVLSCSLQGVALRPLPCNYT